MYIIYVFVNSAHNVCLVTKKLGFLKTSSLFHQNICLLRIYSRGKVCDFLGIRIIG